MVFRHSGGGHSKRVRPPLSRQQKDYLKARRRAFRRLKEQAAARKIQRFWRENKNGTIDLT